MKKIIITILVLISIQSYGQIWKLYAERKNTDATIDSFFTKFPKVDSIFNEAENFVSFTVEVTNQLNLEAPSAFANYHKGADGIYRNYVPFAENANRVRWDSVENKPSTFPATASTVGGNLLGISNPASTSLINVNTNGTVGTRTLTQIQSDLGIDLKANINSPAFTGTPTGIGIPVYARVTGSNATTTGQALVDIPGLSIPLATNAVYEISGMLSVSTSNVTTGVQYGLNYSVAGGAVEAQLSGSLTSTATKTERISTLNTASTAFLTTSNQTGGIIIRGIITTGANAGNLTVKHLKVTSGTSTVFINSVLKVTRIQ